MKENPLKILEALGQSIWLDYIRRDLITSGRLKTLIEEDGLRGITSNPSIFEKAFTESPDYEQEIKHLLQKTKDVNSIYESLSVQDVCSAADVFRPLYDKTGGADGYVSLEVNPHLAHDTQGSIIEARRLWQALNRPNVFIKIPATKEGLPAIKQLISEGVNVNVTLLFGLSRYREVIEAYLSGLELRVAEGKPITLIASVASFFLSRIDTLLDPKFDEIIKINSEQAMLAKGLVGEVAIASAKIAYQIYLGIINAERFKALFEKGASVQRLLWASTSTKNPRYNDVKYVEALIGKNTVNTLPIETLNAFRDHGIAKSLLEVELDKANKVFQQLPTLGIDIDQVTQQLEDEGVDKFNHSFDLLIKALHDKLTTKIE